MHVCVTWLDELTLKVEWYSKYLIGHLGYCDLSENVFRIFSMYMYNVYTYNVSKETSMDTWNFRAHSRLAPSQWVMLLQSNAVSHWLGANLELALNFVDSTVPADGLALYSGRTSAGQVMTNCGSPDEGIIYKTI